MQEEQENWSHGSIWQKKSAAPTHAIKKRYYGNAVRGISGKGRKPKKVDGCCAAVLFQWQNGEKGRPLI